MCCLNANKMLLKVFNESIHFAPVFEYESKDFVGIDSHGLNNDSWELILP